MPKDDAAALFSMDFDCNRCSSWTIVVLRRILLWGATSHNIPPDERTFPMVLILPPPTEGRGLAAVRACIDCLDLVSSIANGCVLAALVSEPIQAAVR